MQPPFWSFPKLSIQGEIIVAPVVLPQWYSHTLVVEHSFLYRAVLLRLRVNADRSYSSLHVQHVLQIAPFLTYIKCSTNAYSFGSKLKIPKYNAIYKVFSVMWDLHISCRRPKEKEINCIRLGWAIIREGSEWKGRIWAHKQIELQVKETGKTEVDKYWVSKWREPILIWLVPKIIY